MNMPYIDAHKQSWTDALHLVFSVVHIRFNHGTKDLSRHPLNRRLSRKNFKLKRFLLDQRRLDRLLNAYRTKAVESHNAGFQNTKAVSTRTPEQVERAYRRCCRAGV
jgi:formamidopyrimidine-DNA glycosylase